MHCESVLGKMGSLSVSSYSPHSMKVIHYIPISPWPPETNCVPVASFQLSSCERVRGYQGAVAAVNTSCVPVFVPSLFPSPHRYIFSAP